MRTQLAFFAVCHKVVSILEVDADAALVWIIPSSWHEAARKHFKVPADLVVDIAVALFLPFIQPRCCRSIPSETSGSMDVYRPTSMELGPVLLFVHGGLPLPKDTQAAVHMIPEVASRAWWLQASGPWGIGGSTVH